jgi:hypothetical protein
MPLLKNDEFALGPTVPDPSKKADDAFVVRVTGEVVYSYEEYLAKVHLYLKPEWQDRFSGKGGLTYEAALSQEQKALSQLAQVALPCCTI